MVKFRIQPAFWLMLCLIILVLPLPWVCALILSSTVHECSHLAAMRLSGVSVHGMILGPGGAVLETGEMTPLQGMVSAFAGPVGPLLLILVARWMPRTALCALIQGLYHLLPVRPLDGGRALEYLTAYHGWDRRICSAAEGLILFLVAYLGIGLMLTGLGVVPLFLCVMLLLRVFLEKFLANRPGNEYNRPTKS